MLTTGAMAGALLELLERLPAMYLTSTDAPLDLLELLTPRLHKLSMAAKASMAYWRRRLHESSR